MSGVKNLSKFVRKSINRDAEATPRAVFVIFVLANVKMIKIQCFEPVTDPSLLIQNEKWEAAKDPRF